jgi:polar amino acid transport system substrate-binding protein
VTRGAIEDQELTKVAPPSTDIKRFEDNNATVSAFVSGQTQLIATGASVAGNMMAQEPAAGRRIQVRAQGLAQLHRRGQGRGQAAPKVNEIIAAPRRAATSTRWP